MSILRGRAIEVKVALASLVLVTAALIAAPGAWARTSAHPVLNAVDGPGFTITLKQKGKNVKTLKPGVYTIKVADKSNIHNFHLTGAGVNKTTSVAKVYSVTWTVTLKKGTYTYVCDPHKEIMRGSFKVA